MIVFDLCCDDGHRFESWFQSGAAFDRQQADGAIECPLCGSHAIAKAPMAAHVAHTAEAGETGAVAEGGPPAEMLEALCRLRRHIEENCDYVGPAFPEQARRTFYGEIESRGIYGEASLVDAVALRDEGIEVQPLPWFARRNG
jgi:hypothetical protein